MSRSLSRLETQDIKTQPQFNHDLDFFCSSFYCVIFCFIIIDIFWPSGSFSFLGQKATACDECYQENIIMTGTSLSCIRLLGLVFWNSIHLEVASDSFCFLCNCSWLLVFILYVFLFILSGFNLYCWKGIHFS